MYGWGAPKARRALSGALYASQGYSRKSPLHSKNSREPIPGKFPNDFG